MATEVEFLYVSMFSNASGEDHSALSPSQYLGPHKSRKSLQQMPGFCPDHPKKSSIPKKSEMYSATEMSLESGNVPVVSEPLPCISSNFA